MRSDHEELNDEYPRLYRRHREMVWRMCARYAGHDLDLARDLAQDVYIALWVDYEALRARGNLKVERAWVWWHTRTILSHHSRRRRLTALPMGYDNADSERQQREEMLEHLQHLTAHRTGSGAPLPRRLQPRGNRHHDRTQHRRRKADDAPRHAENETVERTNTINKRNENETEHRHRTPDRAAQSGHACGRRRCGPSCRLTPNPTAT